MNSFKNNVQLIGHVGQEPEIITTESGEKLAKLSLATNDSFTNNQGEKITNTDWHNIIAWNGTANIIEQYVAKGKEIGVQGKLTTRSWEDKEGVKRYTTEVVCNEILLLGSK